MTPISAASTSARWTCAASTCPSPDSALPFPGHSPAPWPTPRTRSWTSSRPSAPRGFAALRELALTFDGVEQTHPRVPAEALRAALDGLDPAVRAALEESIRRARSFADAQRPANIDVELGEGAVVSQNWVPVARVGLYVPGGLAVYPSSVIMNVVPALAAGVESIALASPPQKDFGGLPHPTHPGGGLPARHRRGLCDRRGAGHRRLRLRHPGDGRRRQPRRDRARGCRHRSGQHLRGHRQAAGQGGGGDRFRGRHHGDRHPRGRHRQSRPRGGGPHQPGRTRPQGGIGPRSPTPKPSPPTSAWNSSCRPPPPSTPAASSRRSPARSPASSWCRTWNRASPHATRTPRNTWRS